MADTSESLPESPVYEPSIYLIKTSDPVVGGVDGISNKQATQLGNRTAWLKGRIDGLISGVIAAGKAARLSVARTLSFTGAATGSTTFDGSANASVALTLADSGVVAGTYPKVTVNVKGLVTGGASLLASDIPALDWTKITTGRPTTLGGYGITDALAKTEAVTAPVADKLLRLNSAGQLPASITGNAATASKLEAARTISLTGGATGSAAFDGAANVSINVTVDPAAHGHTISQVTGLQAALDSKFSTAGGTLTGNIVISTDWWSSIALQGGYGDRVMLHAGGLEGGNELRIGRYSRLDGSWISNPFVFKMETGELYATRLIGNGSGLVELNANYLGEGTVPIARLVGTYNINVNGTAAAATKLAAQRTLSASGDASWAVAFDGTSNVSATITLANSGVAAGSYPKVTVNAKGLVTGGAALASADIPALDTSKLTTGILPTARGGTGNGSGQAQTALKLATPRAITITGAGSGSANFDGGANISIPLTVNASNIQAGTLPLSRGGVGATTPAGARANIGAGAPATASLAVSGWWRDEDTGFIEQWIQASGADNTEVVVNLPIAFPNQGLNVIATPVGPSSAPGSTGSLSVSASFINNSQVRLGLNWSGGSPSPLVHIRAIGR